MERLHILCISDSGDLMSGFKNDVVYAKNADFSQSNNLAPAEGNGLATDGELWIGTTVLNAGGTHVNVGNIISPGGSITVGYSSPDITLDVAGGGTAIEQITVDNSTAPGTNPVLPLAGNITITGGQVVASSLANVIQTHSLAANSFAVTIQRTSAVAAPDTSQNGVAHFDSDAFDVDASGFVQLNGGGIAITSVNVDANTPPGTDPVLPSATGEITVTGAQVAAGVVGTNVIRTDSLAANTYTIEIQRSTAVAGTDAANNGVSHFNSADFTVDANGFVSASGTGIGQTITGDSGGALPPTAGNWNIFGRSGSKTSGSGSTLTINSPPFSQVGASATSVLNTGEFVTAAVTRTLPATAGLLDGDLVIYYCTTAGALVITANTGQTIRIGTLVSSSGGTATSTQIGDSVSLRFDATAVSWRCVSVIGTWVMA